MKATTTECSCGEKHQFDASALKMLEVKDAPDYIECGECPMCSPEFFDKPEDREDEAYKEEDIEALLKDEDIEADIDVEEFDMDEEEY